MALKVKFRTQFPAQVAALSPLLLSKIGSSYTFSFDSTAAFTNVTLTNATLISPTITSPILSGALAVTSNSASALAVGANGTTNPVLQVDASTGSVATGWRMFGNAAGAAVGMTVISSATNESGAINAKGSGPVIVGNSSTGGVQLGSGGGGVTVGSALTYGGVTLTNAVAGTGSMVLSTSPSITTPTLTNPVVSGAVNGALSVSSSSASAFTVGLNGATNPVLQINSSVGSQAAGLSITGNATGSGVGLAAIDSGTNTPMSINAKGSGTVTIGNSSTGNIVLSRALNYGGVTLSNAVTGTGNMVLSTSPALTTPNLGTPTAITLTSATGLPIATGLTGAGTGVLTALANATNAASGVATTSGVLSWTPAITASGTPGTPVYSVQVGSYERVGNTVTAWFDIQLTSWGGSPAGNITITGLPVSSGATANDFGGCVMSAFSGFATNLGWLTARVAPSSTAITMLYVPQAGATATAILTFTQITPGTNLVIMGMATYHV